MAERETRSIVVADDADQDLPPGMYGFPELFCNEPECDCRRVFFYAVSPSRAEPLAVVAWGWESPVFYARWLHDEDPDMIEALKGPLLNPGSPQSALAPALLTLVRDVLLADEAYVERIKRHYRMFRAKVDGHTVTRPRVNIKKQHRRKRRRSSR